MSEDLKAIGLFVFVASLVVGGFVVYRVLDHVEYNECIRIGGAPLGSGGCDVKCPQAEREVEELKSALRKEKTKLEFCREGWKQ